MNTPRTIRACGFACAACLWLLPTVGLGAYQPGLGGGGDVSGQQPPEPSPAKKERQGGPERKPAALNGGEVSLKPKFAPGTVLRYELSQSTRQRNRAPSMSEMDGEMRLDQTLNLVMNVSKTDEGAGSTVEVTVERVRLSIDAEGLRAQADTQQAKPGAPASPRTSEDAADKELRERLERVAGEMASEKMTFTLDARGNIVRVTGGDKLAGGALLAAVAGVPTTSGAGPLSLSPAGGSGAGGGAVQWLVGGVAGQPDVVRPGSTWTNRDLLGRTPVGDLVLQTQHKVKSVRAGNAEVTFAGSIEPSPDQSKSSAPVTVDRANYSGDYLWNGDAGRLERMAADLSTHMTVDLSGSKVESESTTTMKVERKER